MAVIKTKDSTKRTIKKLDKTVVGTQKIKQEYIHTKEIANKQNNNEDSSETKTKTGITIIRK